VQPILAIVGALFILFSIPAAYVRWKHGAEAAKKTLGANMTVLWCSLGILFAPIPFAVVLGLLWLALDWAVGRLR
jgi:hypothetical protein